MNFPNGTLQAGGQEVATIETGSFTATLSGFTTTVQGTISYTKVGNVVILQAPAQISGTSNAGGSMTLTGIPSSLWSTKWHEWRVMMLVDNGAQVLGQASLHANSGTIDMNPLAVSGSRILNTGFTASGTKGIPFGWHFIYTLN